ncbi:hypothetical protein ACT7DB_15905 [Bacillus cereus]
MKKNIGFLTFNRSKGKLYVYLMKAFRENGKKEKYYVVQIWKVRYSTGEYVSLAR